MSNTTLYFWKDECELVELPSEIEGSATSIPDEYLELYCVDARHTDAFRRYGMYLESDNWIELSFNKFPKQFKLILLTLGVT